MVKATLNDVWTNRIQELNYAELILQPPFETLHCVMDVIEGACRSTSCREASFVLDFCAHFATPRRLYPNLRQFGWMNLDSQIFQWTFCKFLAH